MKRFMNFLRDEEGATMVEYGLLVALISVVSILIIAAVGRQIKGGFTSVSTEMTTAGIADPGP